ncbi:PHP domain-containing protein [Clostridium sp. JNZ J1-5]
MIDLHCHSKKSDGSMEIWDIIEMAKNQGITHLAITDHDTILGISEAQKIGKNFGIEVIPGIEMSAFDYVNNKKVHILAYYIETDSKLLNSLCNLTIKMRNEDSIKIIDKLAKQGYKINLDDVQNHAKGSICINKKHIIQTLIDKGYYRDNYNELYRDLIQQLSTSIKYINVQDIIRAIIISGGVPVLAHPGVFNNYKSIEKLVEFGLQGIEVEHPEHTKEDKRLCRYFSKKYDLIETGGFDFHGIYGSRRQMLGCETINISTVERLEQRNRENIKELKVV